MFGVLTAGTAVLEESDFFGSIGLVAFGDIVEVPALGAFQTH